MSEDPGFELVTLKSGLKSLRSLDNLETFHPVIGPRQEAYVLHVEQQRICQRALNREAEPFVLWDVGLGGAANATAAIEALTGIEGASCEIHSFDKTLAPLRFVLKNVEELSYIAAFRDVITPLLTEQVVQIRPGLRWFLHLGDFREALNNLDIPAPDAIFYDPYSPQGNHEMWRLAHFERLFGRLDPAQPCLLTNYTRSTAVRTTLLLAGFYVGIGGAVGNKQETTIASNRLELLERPLTRTWLGRLGASSNAAPLRGEKYLCAPISAEDLARIESHPQFLDS